MCDKRKSISGTESKMTVKRECSEAGKHSESSKKKQGTQINAPYKFTCA